MRYRVRGVVRGSGKIFDKEAEAPSEEILRARAEERGITVVAIDLVSAPPEETIELEPIEESAQARQSRLAPVPVQDAPSSEPDVAPSSPQTNAPPTKGGRALGSIALLLGVLALITWWVPSIGAMSVPLAGLGMLLGLVALAVSVSRRGRGIGMAIAGSAICGLAVAGGLGDVAGIKSYIEEVKSRFAASQPPLAETAEPIPAPGHSSRTVRVGKPEEGGNAPKPTAVAKLGEVIRSGDVEITVEEARLAQAQFVTQGGAVVTLSEKPMLILTWTVKNDSKTKKFLYVSPADQASLRVIDNFENTYAARRSHYSKILKGSTLNKELYPGESVQDVVAFERLVDGVTQFDVTIPGGVIGQRTDIRLRVQASELTTE